MFRAWHFIVRIEKDVATLQQAVAELNATGEQGVGNIPIRAQESSICAHLKLETLQQMYPWKRWNYSDKSKYDTKAFYKL